MSDIGSSSGNGKIDDKIWQSYSRVYDIMECIPFRLELRQKYVAAMNGLELVLDNGCGTGLITQELAANQERRIVGIDSSSEMLEKAKQRLSHLKNVRLYQADAQNLPYANCVFDGIICNMVLYLLNDPHAAISEMSRVLKPNGMVSITSPLRSLDVEVLIEATYDYFSSVDATLRSQGKSGLSSEEMHDLKCFIDSNRELQKRIKNLYNISEVSELLKEHKCNVVLQENAYLGQCFFVVAVKRG